MSARASPLQATRSLVMLMQIENGTSQAQNGSDRYELRQVTIRRFELRSARRLQESLHRLKNLFGANQPYAIFSAEGATPPAMGAAWTAWEIFFQYNRFG